MISIKYTQQSRGFTIVELLVTIVVVGILAAITIVAYNEITGRSAVVVLKSDLDTASALLTSDYVKTGSYAANADSLPKSSGTVYTYKQVSTDYCLSATSTKSGNSTFHISSVKGVIEEGDCKIVGFVVAWGDTGTEYGESLIKTSDGGYVVTGYTDSYGVGDQDMFLTKYDSSGTLSWSKTWGGAGIDRGHSLIQTNDGGYAVAGYTASYGAGGGDMFLAKYDSAGTLSWDKTWGGGGGETGLSLIQTNDGGYAVTGNTASYGAGGQDMFVVKYDSVGTLSWDKTWGGGGFDRGYSIAQTIDGGCIVTGTTDLLGGGNSDMFLAKYDSAGTLSWDKTWGGTTFDNGSDLILTSDGGYAVTGGAISYGAGSFDMFLAKYDSAGTLSWDKTWGGAGLDYGDSLVQTSDSGYAVTGYTASYGAGGYDMFLAKYDSAGTLSWNKTWGGTANDSGRSLVQTSDSGYAVTGYTTNYGAGGYDMFLNKYDSAGTIVSCYAPMCQSPNAGESNPNAGESNPDAGESNPDAGESNPDADESNFEATSSAIVAPF